MLYFAVNSIYAKNCQAVEPLSSEAWIKSYIRAMNNDFLSQRVAESKSKRTKSNQAHLFSSSNKHLAMSLGISAQNILLINYNYIIMCIRFTTPISFSCFPFSSEKSNIKFNFYLWLRFHQIPCILHKNRRGKFCKNGII